MSNEAMNQAMRESTLRELVDELRERMHKVETEAEAHARKIRGLEAEVFRQPVPGPEKG